MNHNVYTTHFESWRKNINSLLDSSTLLSALNGQPRVIIKPNLVEALQPPITTPVDLVAAIVDFLREAVAGLSIVIAEGSGSLAYDTGHTFNALGYRAMAHEKGVELVDLNEAESGRFDKPECGCWPHMYLPKMIFDTYLISIPVLKAHTLAGVTLTMKNMMGVAPPAHYQQGGHWKKAAFHANIHEAVFNLNQYRTPDFTILDATIGMSTAHLWGPHCDPAVNQIAVGEDSVAIDAYGCELLGKAWQEIGHIAMANNVLGRAESYEIVRVDC